MKILLVHPPVGSDMPLSYAAESLGLGYLAAVLRQDGHEIEIFDAQLQRLNTKEAISQILTRDFECVGITSMHEYKDFLIAAVQAVRKSRKDALIVAGGYLPTLNTEKLLAMCPEIDFVVRGEGETVACDVFGRIARGEDWKTTPGIAYRSGGETVMNPLPPLIQDLDSLPFPARDALKQAKMPEMLYAVSASSRGCFYRCSFCSVNSFYSLSGGHAPRFRSAENFVNEIESVVSATDIKKFAFIDEDFIGPGAKGRERAIQIADDLKARKLGVSFTIDTRADEVDEEILTILKEAGLCAVFLGIESGVQRQLDTFNKKITVEKNRLAIEASRRAGVEVQPGFIMFDPYSTPDELQENMDFIRDTGLYGGPAPVLKVRLYEGVPLADQVRADGLLRENGLDLDYVFKDPQVGMMWKVTQASAKWAKMKQGIKKFFGKDKDCKECG